jgi:hypothetical protein
MAGWVFLEEGRDGAGGTAGPDRVFLVAAARYVTPYRACDSDQRVGPLRMTVLFPRGAVS